MKYVFILVVFLINFSTTEASILPDNYIIPPKANIMQTGIINQNINNIKIPTISDINVETAKYYDKAKSLGLDSSHINLTTSSEGASIFKDGTLFGSSPNTNANLNISDDFLNKLKNQIISSFGTSFGVSDNQQFSMKTFVDLFTKSLGSLSDVIRKALTMIDSMIANNK